MGNIVVDYKMLKKSLATYHSEKNNTIENSFDDSFVRDMENEHQMRFIDVTRCGDHLNAKAYQIKGNKKTTITVKIVDYSKHDTTARFANYLCELVSQRARGIYVASYPEGIDTKVKEGMQILTREALKTMNDVNKISQRTGAIKNQLYPILRQYAQTE